MWFQIQSFCPSCRSGRQSYNKLNITQIAPVWINSFHHVVQVSSVSLDDFGFPWGDLQKVANGANAHHNFFQTVWKFANINTPKQKEYISQISRFFFNYLAVKITTKQRKASISCPHKILIREIFLSVQKFSPKIYNMNMVMQLVSKKYIVVISYPLGLRAFGGNSSSQKYPFAETLCLFAGLPEGCFTWGNKPTLYIKTIFGT